LENTTVATFITKLSDGHHQYRQIEEIAAPPPSSPLNPIEVDLGNNHVHDDPPLPYIDLLEKEIADEAAAGTRARRYVSLVGILLAMLLLIIIG
jgi:hypothetical protein